jgi:hypothetical protein
MTVLEYHTNISLSETVNRTKVSNKVGRFNNKQMTIVITLEKGSGISVGKQIKLSVFSEFLLVPPGKYKERIIIRA